MSSHSIAGAGVDAARAGAAAADDAFGMDLYRVLAQAGTNTVFSPASIAAALRMALYGARGQTAAQIAAALHEAGAGAPEATLTGLRLLGEVAGQGGNGKELTLRAPSTIWVQAGLPLLPGFTGGLGDAAPATVRQADFRGAPGQVRAEINELIAEQTADKITDLLGPQAIDADTRLVLANAIYLKAAWASQFPESATADAPFYPDGDGGPGGEVTVRMMRHTTDLPYLRGDGYQAVLLPYRASTLAMAVVLPDGPLAALAAKLNGGLRGLLAGTERTRVALSMPKFRQRARFGLIPALRQLGVQDAFTGRADFSGITSADGLYISAVAHQAYIDVDERGTEAAAATAVVMRRLALRREPDPVPVTVDRPFLFAIADTASGLPLFLGQVSRPAAG